MTVRHFYKADAELSKLIELAFDGHEVIVVTPDGRKARLVPVNEKYEPLELPRGSED